MMHAAFRAAVALPDALVIQAARAWRQAKDARRPVQPAVFAVLAADGLEMFTPALDSLMALCERRFDRRLCTGCPFAPSDDERMLCRLLDDPAQLRRMGPCRARDPEGLDRALGCALASIHALAAIHLAPEAGPSAPEPA